MRITKEAVNFDLVGSGVGAIPTIGLPYKYLKSPYDIFSFYLVLLLNLPLLVTFKLGIKVSSTFMWISCCVFSLIKCSKIEDQILQEMLGRMGGFLVLSNINFR